MTAGSYKPAAVCRRTRITGNCSVPRFTLPKRGLNSYDYGLMLVLEVQPLLPAQLPPTISTLTKGKA